MLPKVAPYIHIYDATGKVSHPIIQDRDTHDKHSFGLGVARDNQECRTIERGRVTSPSLLEVFPHPKAIGVRFW